MSPARIPTRMEILPGLTVDDISTSEQADEVFDEVIAAVASIEAQLARAYQGTAEEGREWRARAHHALRVKKLAMPQIQARRAVLVRQQKAEANATRAAASRVGAINKSRMLLQIVGEIAPDVITKAVEIAHVRHPNEFGDNATEAA